MKRKTWASIAVAAVLLGSLGSAVARFPPGNVVYDVQYFTDYTYTTRVGGERWTCTGYMNWGTRTIYKVEHTWPCDPAEN